MRQNLSLLISTSSKNSFIAIVKNHNIVSVEQIDNIKICEYLALKMKNILQQNSISLKEIENLYLDIGPGNFTGLRIGISFIFGLTINRKINIFAMTSFDFANILEQKLNPILLLLDAKKSQYYARIKNHDDIFLLNYSELENFIKINKIDHVYADNMHNHNIEYKKIVFTPQNMLNNITSAKIIKNEEIIKALYIREALF